MSEYSVLFATKISAKNKADLERKSEQVGLQLSKCLKKTVFPHSYGEIEKRDTVKRPEEKLC